MQVLAPYLDQNSALLLRQTCKQAAAAASQAVTELQAVLGTVHEQQDHQQQSPPTRPQQPSCPKAPIPAHNVPHDVVTALQAFSNASSCRLYCLLRRSANPACTAAIIQSLQQHLPHLNRLQLLEVKGSGYLSPGLPGHGANAVVPCLPILQSCLQDLLIKSLNPASSTALVLPQLTGLTSMSLDCVMGVLPADLAAAAKLPRLQQLMVRLDVRGSKGATTAGLEVLSSLQQLSHLDVSLVGCFVPVGVCRAAASVLVGVYKAAVIVLLGVCKAAVIAGAGNSSCSVSLLPHASCQRYTCQRVAGYIYTRAYIVFSLSFRTAHLLFPALTPPPAAPFAIS